MFLVILSLVISQSDLNFGHAIPELKNNHEAPNVYELNEINSTPIRIVNPNSELPKLTEIIYYHIIEKPYGNQVTVEETTELDDGLDFDDTRRPFTNGHGYQFTKSEISEDEEKVESEESAETRPDDTVVDEAYDDDSSEEEDQVTDKSDKPTTEKDKVFGEGTIEEDATEIPDTSSEDVITDETTEKGIEPTTEKDEVTGEDILEDDVSTEISDTTTSKPNTTTFKTDVLEKKKQERNQLFNTVRNKYQKLVKHDKLFRRKREVDLNEMPEAPVLPGLDFKILPDDIREQIEKAMTEIDNKHDSGNLNKPEDQNLNIENEKESEENIQDNVEENLDEFFANLSSSLNLDDDKDTDVTNHQIDEIIEQVDEHTHQIDEHTDEIDEHNDQIDEHNDQIDDAAHFEAEKQRIIPRTYGMSLNGDNGYVWNDMYTNPGIYFDVGEDAEKLEHEFQPLINNKKPTEEVIDTTSHPDLVDIHVNIHKEHTTLLPHVDQPNKVENLEEKNTKDIEPIKKLTEAHAETNDDYTAKVGEENNEEMTIVVSENEEHDFDRADDGELDHVKSKNVEKLEEMLQDEKFWKWLAEWTETYMEQLTKYVKRVVKEEILNHEKSLAHGKDKQSKDIIENKKNGKSSDEINKNSDEALSKNADNVNTDEVVSKKSDETVKEPTIEDNNLIFDGKEIPVTHTTNFKDESETEDNEPLLKNRKDKKDTIIHRHLSNKTEVKENSKGNPQSSIKAMNIYGNSMNNEKVTNVYIFLKSLDTKGIEALKPLINGDNTQEKQPINTLVVGNTDKVDVATNTNSKLEEQDKSSHSVDSTTKKPYEKHEVSTEKPKAPQTETETVNDKEMSTTESSTEKVVEDKTERVSTTETPKENENNKVKPQKSEKNDKVSENKETIENNKEATTIVPVGSDKIEKEAKASESHNNEENEKASEHKESVENKSETITVVPGLDKIEEVDKVTEGPTSTTIAPTSTTIAPTSTTTAPTSTTIDPTSTTIVPTSTTIAPEEKEVEKTEIVADDKKETSVEGLTIALPGDNKKKEESTNKESVENKSETITVVPGLDKIEEVNKVTEGPTSTTITPEEKEVEKTEIVADDKKETSVEGLTAELPGDNKKKEESRNKESVENKSETKTVVPGLDKIEEVDKVTEGPTSTIITPEEKEVEKTEIVAGDKKETSVEGLTTEISGDNKKKEESS